MDQDIFLLITEFMLLTIAVVSMAIFVTMLTFKGKSALDWFLAFRELAIFILVSRIFAIIATPYEVVPAFQAAAYLFLATVCLGVLVTLIREHVFYKNAPSLRERWKRMRKVK